ncbi:MULTISPECIES: ABC transporter ATP-binding protein [unclassified Gilliamella]|uniref:ABC transporter ATP-binding protein n=1 Tax=unclassified Gilliamella TaxID=2685620 RepID=UPI002269F801|nr:MULTISPECIES: ABC transporter ATP-binding protein [unclassified Gilliamella]MCX8641509.1 ABC transporter ATP-binding protein [Gilliamella sp. B3835]MCX8706724.1 ABC transporter ATP-binding protein [Gilliamella sp. B3783]MCX8708582.1 ABC transporter ATP-binding protein [Gilliamella sp. B3780]MCX8713887.1 ABC transporter ATP-binding protein [Gilliamella sp. B3781]MCX8715672.1 ABC transporter ATP-binding protein [Gilliamella sp. B3784]
MSLINLTNAYLSFSDAPLLDHIDLSIEVNERVCLVGRNGAGKSTLLKVLNKEVPLDEGQIIYENNVIVSRLQQDPPRDIQGNVFDFVAEGLKDQAQLLRDYYDLSHQIEQNPTESNLTKLAKIQEQLDHQNGWQLDNRIRNVISSLSLDGDALLSSLSGGWLRKAALAKALVCQPTVLLLDEPTNHLDIETIKWLEEFLKSFNGSIVFISHDRSFIRQMATRIIDLDRGKVASWGCDYDSYLIGKEEALRVEELQNAEFDKKLAQEEVWIRQGIKARRTRNEGRVRALKAMRQEHRERRQVMGSAKMQIEEALRSGKIVFELDNVSYQIENKQLINDFTVQVLRGDKIALIGPNGVGKTTLLKLMLGDLVPTSGHVHCGTKLEVAYFDQYRLELDPEKNVMDNLAEGKQEVMVNGRSRHVLGYLQDFLFPPKRARTPVRALSGGERNRLLLAKLFLKPSNLLVLDEPTNDLDIETLELLEELVNDYQGTVLLVSHDRQFVDNVVTQCWFFEDHGHIGIYAGGYSDALQQQQQANPVKAQITLNQSSKSTNNEANIVVDNKDQTTKKRVKLSYNEQRELTQLPIKIEQLEVAISDLQTQIGHSDFFNQPHDVTSKILQDLADKEAELETVFTRWEQLESLSQ